MGHSRIALVVFDVDGTLYRQGPLKLRMAASLAAALLTGRLSATQLRTLSTYRRMRETVAERGGSPVDAIMATATAEKCSADVVAGLEREWLLRRPLAHIESTSLPGVEHLLHCLKTDGVCAIAWSDYPVDEKVAALGLHFDHLVCANDDDVRALKPSPAGLTKAMELAGASAHETLVVGDRDERDGAAARAAGADFVLAERGLTEAVIGDVRRRTGCT